MALDLGVLSGRIFMDIAPAQRALLEFQDNVRDSERRLSASGQDAGEALGDGIYRGADGRLRNARNQFVSEAEVTGRATGEALGDSAAQAADQGGAEVTSRFSGALRAGAAGVIATAAGLGVAAASGLTEAMSREVEGDRLGASLGVSEAAADRLGRSAGKVYRDAFGESFEEVAASTEAVMSTFQDVDRGSGLDRLTKQAMTLADIMGADVPAVVQVAQQLIDEGMATSGEDAFDKLTKASQKTRVSLRGDLLDITSEYAPFFKMLGYDGPQMLALLSDANSAFDMDKTADAIKEFGILVGGDLPKTKPVLERLGLDYTKVSNDLLAGGDRSAKATRNIIDALGEIEGPGEQARMSLELFGAPFEDLALSKVPQLLDSLKIGEDALGDFGGAAQDAVDQTGDNATSRFTQFKRTMQDNVVTFIDAEVLPALSDLGDALNSGEAPGQMAAFWEDIRPGVEAFGSWLMDDFIPTAVEAFGDLSEALSDFGDDIAEKLAEHPEVAEFLGLLGEAIAWMAENQIPAMVETWETLFPILADGFGAALDAVEMLAIGLTYVGEYGAASAGVLLDAFGWVFEEITEFFDSTIGWALEKIGRDNPFDDALANFRDFREGATTGLEEIETNARAMREQLQREITPKVNEGPAMEAIRRLSTALNEMNPGVYPGEGGGGRTTPDNPRVPSPREIDERGGRDGRTVSPTSSRGGNTYVQVEKVVTESYDGFVRQADHDRERANRRATGGMGGRRHFLGN